MMQPILTSATQRRPDLPQAEPTLEQSEARYWAECAEPGAAPDNYRDQCDGLHLCQLPFMVRWKDRKGKIIELRVTSRSVSDHSAVLLSRKPLPMFDIIEVQMDDGTERPIVPAKVVDYDQTIGGYLAHVEFLIDPAQSSQEPGAHASSESPAAPAASSWAVEPATSNQHSR